MQTKTSPLTLNSGPQRNATPRFIRFIQAAAAVLIVGALIAGSLLIFSGRLGKPQQANPGGPQPASPPGIYISRSNIIYRLDVQTRKVIWQKSMSSQSTSSTDLSIAVINDAIYVSDNNSLSGGPDVFALDAQTGTLRWSRTFTQSVTSPFMDQGLLYFNTRTILYAVNPANGSIVATYTPQYGASWYAPIVVDGVLYYTDSSSSNILYVEQLSDKKLLWQQQLSNDPLTLPANGGIVVQNGIVYMPVTPMTTSQNGWVDAFDAHSGKKLWQSPAIMAADGGSTLLITNTMIYVSTLSGTSGRLLAFDVHTHALIWQHPYETYDMQVASGILYIYFDVNTHTQYPSVSSFFAALNASTGKLLWETPPNPVGGNMLINIVHGIFYGVVWDTLKGNAISGTIYALDARKGTQIWTMPTNANVLQWGGMVVV